MACAEQKSSSCRVINRLLFIKIIFLSPMDAFSFSFIRSVPFVAPGAGHGLPQPIASESSPRIQLSGPQKPCQCSDSCTLHAGRAVRGERLQGSHQFLPDSHHRAEGKRCARSVEGSWLGMPGRSTPAWKKRLR